MGGQRDRGRGQEATGEGISVKGDRIHRQVKDLDREVKQGGGGRGGVVVGFQYISRRYACHTHHLWTGHAWREDWPPPILSELEPARLRRAWAGWLSSAGAIQWRLAMADTADRFRAGWWWADSPRMKTSSLCGCVGVFWRAINRFK